MSLRAAPVAPWPVAAEVATGTRAVIVDAPGSEPRVGSVVLPDRLLGTTLLAVIAAPLNPLDLLIASGNFDSARYERPYVPGSECVGVVLESGFHTVGSRVYAECHASPSSPGAFAARVLVRDEDVLPLPDSVDSVQAAAVGNSGTAAWMPLIQTAGLRAGETVLVLGATGAVGRLAVQIARHHGAGRIVGVGRDAQALQRVLALGADVVVDLRAHDDEEGLASRLEAAAAGSVDVVLDGLYGLPLQAALRVCAQRARVVNIGNLAGPTAVIPAGLLRGRQITLSGFAGLHTALGDKKPALSWLWSALTRGELHVDVRTMPLREFRPPGRHRRRHRTPRSSSCPTAPCSSPPRSAGAASRETTTPAPFSSTLKVSVQC